MRRDASVGLWSAPASEADMSSSPPPLRGAFLHPALIRCFLQRLKETARNWQRRANQKSIAALAQRIVSLLAMPISMHAVIGPVSYMN
jgi:hypothetical protein